MRPGQEWYKYFFLIIFVSVRIQGVPVNHRSGEEIHFCSRAVVAAENEVGGECRIVLVLFSCQFTPLILPRVSPRANHIGTGGGQRLLDILDKGSLPETNAFLPRVCFRKLLFLVVYLCF